MISRLEDPDDRASGPKSLEWGFRSFETRTLFAANQQSAMPRCLAAKPLGEAWPEQIKVMCRRTAARS
jgi:D-alanyl-D-alanine carboxypeptidase (penicillin-binding protein 5/6)